MPRTRECDYCGADIEPGTGTMLVRNDGTTIHFCSSKCENNADLGREARNLGWTEAGRATTAAEDAVSAAAEDAVAEEEDADTDEEAEADDGDASDEEVEDADTDEEAEADDGDASDEESEDDEEAEEAQA